MSLITEALKKAQRQRTEATAGGEAPANGSAIQKRGTPLRAQTLILLVAASATLIVCSVVLTVIFVNRTPAPPPRPAAVAAPTRAPVSTGPSPIVLVSAPAPAPTPVTTTAAPAAGSPTGEAAPVITRATPEPLPVSTAPVVAATLAPSVQPPEPTASAAAGPNADAPTADRLTPVRGAAPSSPAGPDPRILSFVDAIRVTGVRSSGSDSKVLMNDRVYRVNDIVDRTLGLKLVKVERDALTFTDPAGLVYTKSF